MAEWFKKIPIAAPKLDLSKTEDRLKMVILTLGVVMLLFAGVISAQGITTSPDFCIKCHEMRPEYMTWKVTSHANVSCSECHFAKGSFGTVVLHRLGAIKELIMHTTGLYETPIVMEDKIESNVCKQCHSVDNRFFTVSGDLIVPHDKHDQQQVACVECHSGVAHGDIGRRELTADRNYEVWTVEYATKHTEGKNRRPRMNTCMECHYKREVTTACEACHKQIVLPADHEEPDWMKVHGKNAEKDLASCNKCHSYSVENPVTGKPLEPREYARQNVFCFECHMTRPVGHGDDWKIKHKHDVTNEAYGCLVCHERNKFDPSKVKATPTYCDQCHLQQEAVTYRVDASGQITEHKQQTTGGAAKGKTGKVHQADWRTVHPTFIKERGISGGKCYDCHERTHCYECHTSGGQT